jgi:dihydroorotase (multifunctional complex type)
VLDLRILSGVVVSDGAAAIHDIGIEAGRIVEVEESGRLGPARRELDATGLHVLPGAIDVHFHCRAPSHPERGTFESETRAAAAGGVTTIFEMPISDPACSTPEVFRQRRTLAEREANVNFALYSGAALGPAAAAEMAAEGAIGFKLFTVTPAPDREVEFRGLWASGEPAILDALAAVGSTGLPCVIHAENEALLSHYRSLATEDGAAARPPIVEALAIAQVATLAREAEARIHIAHVTSRAALAAVRGAIAMGAAVSAETCPQYLMLDSSAVERFGGVAKIAPPLREPADSEALWDGLGDGTLSVVASDHAPFLLHEKADVPFSVAPQGLPTVELLVPVMLDAAARGRLPLELAVSLITSAPARLFGLYPEKGCIAPGSDADLALVSLTDVFHPEPASLVTRAAGCGIVFGGMSLQARVRTTIVNGRVVYSDGNLVSSAGGRFTPGRAAAALEPV